MLMISITIASLVALSVVTVKSYLNKERALDAKAKYTSIKAYADDAARRILTLEEDKSNLAATVTRLTNNHQSIADQLLAEKRKNANKARPVKAERAKVEAPVATMKAEKQSRRGRPNKA
jgi:hypothetical protein